MRPPCCLLIGLLLVSACRPAAGPPPADPEPAPPHRAEAAGPVVRVLAAYPGANARVVADTVAAPLFQQINGVEGAVRIESESCHDGTCTLTVRLAAGTDPNVTQVLVQNRVAVAEPQLPEEVRRAGLTVRKGPAGPPVFWLALSSPERKHDQALLAGLARFQVSPEIARVPGVADVRVIGAGEYTVRAWLDPDKLAARQLTTQDVIAALQRRNVQVAAGPVGQPPNPPGQQFQLTVTTPGRLSDPAQFEQIVLRTTADGQVVYLRDVARLEPSAAGDGLARLNGRPAALLAVTAWPGRVTAEQLRKGFDPAKLADGVRLDLVADLTADRVAWVEVRLPAGTSRERTEEVTRRASELVRGLPGPPDCLTLGADREPGAATVLVKLPAKDGPDLAALRKALADVPEANCRVSEVSAGREPFPVRLAVLDPDPQGEKDHRAATEALAERVRADGAATDVAVFPSLPLPQLLVTVDRAKLERLGVTLDDVLTTVRGPAGGAVIDFDRFGRSVSLAASPTTRATVDDLRRLQVRNKDGQMVPLGSVAEVHIAAAPPAIVQVNGHPALVLTANPPAGRTAAEAAARCRKLAEEVLPRGFRAEILAEAGE